MPTWPHAPVQRLEEPGAYIVTAGTYLRQHLFHTAARLDLALERLFELAERFGWALQAWAVMQNHYHFVGISPEDPRSLKPMLAQLHTDIAGELNREDDTPGRRVWYQYWDTHITYERSYLARLNYVHQNPVHHGIVAVATEYRWCSAAWFEREASPAFVKTVASFKIDRVHIFDDF